MERFRLTMSHFSIHAISSAVANPDLMWRVMISGMAIVATIISVISFLSYLWASHSAVAVAAPTKDRGGFTREEVHATIDLYAAKQKRYDALVQQAPPAPKLTGVGGMSTTDVSSLVEVIDQPALDDGPQP